ncbi:Protein kinase domain containing protein [Aphelenchoides avenae]|nr:Protein kinase domain containing protein [Aphelenchus avenae]
MDYSPKRANERQVLAHRRQAPPANHLPNLPGVQAMPANHQGTHHRGKTAPRHLQEGVVLNGKFRITGFIGGGGFGQIYKACDERKILGPLAVKVEPRDQEAGRMILEQRVLHLQRGKEHAPVLLASGNIGDFMYIVMEMLGPNLGDLRRRRATRQFTLGTVLRVGKQMVEALRDVHSVGFLHRDVKPSNMCVGNANRVRTIYLVDFGMTRQFRYDDGTIRKERFYAGFRGTSRYVSLTVHDRKEQGPVDDMWSLLYTLVELSEGQLPWRQLTDPEEIARKKRNVRYEDMIRNMPLGTKDFLNHLLQLNYHQLPDYSLLINILMRNLPRYVTESTPYDWEDQLANWSRGSGENTAS